MTASAVPRRAVIFDLFGTLVEAMAYRAYEAMLVEMAAILGAPHAKFVERWEATLPQRFAGGFDTIQSNLAHICAGLGLARDAATLDAAFAARRRVTSPLLKTPRPEAIPALAALRTRGLRIGLLTDCTPEVPEYWAESPLAAHVDAPVFSSTARMTKPDPRIYALACDRLRVAPGECLYVGDGGSRELTGAAAAGMTAVLLRTTPREDALLHRSEARTWTGSAIDSLAEVPGLI